MNQPRKCRLNESGITTKYLRKQIDAILDHFDLDTKYDAREEKENLRNHSQEAEVWIVLFFCLFPKKKERKLLEGGVVRPKLTCIMDSSSTILLA